MKISKFYSILSFLVLVLMSACKQPELIKVFPLDNYDQIISHWINPTNPNYNKVLISPAMQQKHVEIFKNHYFGSSSPWSKAYVTKILQTPAPDDLKTTEKSVINLFDNNNKSQKELGFGENFHPTSTTWLSAIANNIHLDQLTHPDYLAKNRGIAVDNLHARVLPTEDVNFLSHKIAGQGYPFDNLQMSSLWAGTPVYILGETRDHAWYLVLTPDFIAWVKSIGIARVNDAFVKKWSSSAGKNLIAITRTQTSIVDDAHKFRFLAYVGAVFPQSEQSSHKILIPIVSVDKQALISEAEVAQDAFVHMPLQATPHEFGNIMSSLIGRPYGWGNLYFYNDCSSELKNLFTPFGVWLPRHSSDQVYAGKAYDVSKATTEQRLRFLQAVGREFVTIVYVGGHVILYIGNFPNPHDHNKEMAMTYQDMWGLSPKPSIRRAVVGRSVLFPLLLSYPEDKKLVSQAGKHFFQVSFLDEVPNDQHKIEVIDLKSLMSPF